LPKWFDLKKYERAPDLDPESWNFQIAIRSACFNHLCVMRSPEPYLSEWDGPILEALNNLRSIPIASATCPAFDHNAFSWCHETVAAVRSLTRFDLLSTYLRARQRFTPSDCELINELDESPFILSRFPINWLNATVDQDCAGCTNHPVIIDLRFSNKVLRQHFEIYLRRLRRHEGRPEDAKKQSPNLEKWGKVGVLPCIDLLLWEKELDGRITDSVLAGALGPQGQVDREKIRKTLRPLVEALVAYHFTHGHLSALAYSDRAERAEVRNRRSAKRRR